MSCTSFVHVSSDSEVGDTNEKNVKKRAHSYLETVDTNGMYDMKRACQKLKRYTARYELESDISSTENDRNVLDQGGSCVAESIPRQQPSVLSAPICRQFWKAGNYEQSARTTMKNGNSHMCIHPEFLHSNATSHKWVFGAIAELLDNAVDEIQNGATYVVIDKTTNLRDGSPALLIQDDGGGMDPDAFRHCMSFGFSDKKKNAIGQYGNGFKTSSMRLGSDVIVFTRHSSERALIQSVGLLSYTFLRQTGHDRIVVPLVTYEFKESTKNMVPLHSHGKEHFSSNLSVLLQWSPYSTEEILLKQIKMYRDQVSDHRSNMLGLYQRIDSWQHGTKIVIYNLWLNDKDEMELDFDSDAEDIRINADAKLTQIGLQSKPIQDQNITNLYQYSLRVYASILYLRLPQSFKIVLRGREVEHHNIFSDLKFPEFILYKPHIGNLEASVNVITTIGFLKDAPHVNAHGFSIYHWNRLILPFWPVVRNTTNYTSRGIVGVLEANYIQPTHNKQEFEKTSLFQKLEFRLKQMTLEYWDIHCELIGYQHKKKSRTRRPPLGLHNHVASPAPLNSPTSVIFNSRSHDYEPSSRATESDEYHNATMTDSLGRETSRYGKEKNSKMASGHRKYEASRSCATDTVEVIAGQPSNDNDVQLQIKQTYMQEENQKLRLRLLDLEKREEALNLKAQQLRDELSELQQEYEKLLDESVSIYLGD